MPLMQKKSISVYQPSDPLEKAIQDTYHEYEGTWLPSHVCQIAAKAFCSLKIFDSTWIEEDNLYKQRCSYLFSPEFVQNKDIMVFLTMPLFLRDVLENNLISSVTSNPVTFTTPTIAHYLYKEYPVKIYIKKDLLISGNNCQWFHVGGFLITDTDVNLPRECIIKIKHADNVDVPQIGETLGLKAASLNGIFHVDEVERVLMPGMKVIDKTSKTGSGVIETVEPGENGMVHMQFQTGNTSIGKQLFDTRFSLVE